MILNWLTPAAFLFLASNAPLQFEGLDADARDVAINSLELVGAYPINSSQPAEPSGLYVRDGVLFVVCDKTENTIFRVELRGAEAWLVPHVEFTPPPKPYPAVRQMDLEGITMDSEGNFYIVSEEYFRVVKVTPEGDASWFGPDLETIGRDAGFFRVHGGGLEGITYLGEDTFLLAAERQARGFIELRKTDAGFETQTWSLSQTGLRTLLPTPRVPDFTGLFIYQERTFVLFRNASSVVEMSRGENGDWTEATAWSYRHIENDDQWRYQSSIFGHGEGLAIDDQFFYVVFDNNQMARVQNADDNRPLLLVFKNPLNVIRQHTAKTP
jgi:hypothetical protein